MGMAAPAGAGRAAVMVAAAVLLLAGGACADCYGDCFNDCMGKFKNMRDYCSYACDKVCNPDADATLQHQQRPLAAAAAAAWADHHHPLDKKQDADAASVRPPVFPDHPFHGDTHGHGGAAAVEPAGEPDPGRVGRDVVRPARVPVLP